VNFVRFQKSQALYHLKGSLGIIECTRKGIIPFHRWEKGGSEAYGHSLRGTGEQEETGSQNS
jgi:hypothetical protein